MRKRINRFRELWSVPRFRALFKLGCWALFFMIFFLLLFLGNHQIPDQERVESPLYQRMIQDLNRANLTINYYITAEESYFIDGTIINNVLEGTLETDEINRIRITPNEVYIVTRDEEIRTDILANLNLSLLFPNEIFKLIEDAAATSDDNRIFSYQLEDLTIRIYTNEDYIYQIIIIEDNITYKLEFNII